MRGTVSGNRFYNLSRQGLYIDAWDQHIEDIDVFNNIVSDCSFGFVLATEQKGDVSNVRVHHNIFYNNRDSGIEIINWGNDNSLEGPKKNIMIYNNTVYNNGWKENWRAFGGIHIQAQNVSNVLVTGNIVSNNCAFQIAHNNQAGLIFSYNLIDGHNKLPLRDTNGTYYARNRFPYIPIDGDSATKSSPLFIDPKGADFRLSESSPAINKGNPAKLFQDPDGSRSDIGALPTTIPLSNEVQEMATNISLFPNPTKQGEAIYLTVKFKNIIEMKLFNLQNVAQLNITPVDISNNLCMISLEGVNKGIYLLKVKTNDDEAFIRKVVVY
jgi:hypothetical protein